MQAPRGVLGNPATKTYKRQVRRLAGGVRFATRYNSNEPEKVHKLLRGLSARERVEVLDAVIDSTASSLKYHEAEIAEERAALTRLRELRATAEVVGHVVRLQHPDGGFLAVPRNGETLGIFKSEGEATEAIVARQREATEAVIAQRREEAKARRQRRRENMASREADLAAFRAKLRQHAMAKAWGEAMEEIEAAS